MEGEENPQSGAGTGGRLGLDLSGLKRRALHLPVDEPAAKLPRRHANRNFELDLRSGLKCYPEGKSKPFVCVDEQFVSTHLIDGDAFRPGASRMAAAAMQEHTSWPPAFSICWPNSQRIKSRPSASPASSGGSAQPACSGGSAKPACSATADSAASSGLQGGDSMQRSSQGPSPAGSEACSSGAAAAPAAAAQPRWGAEGSRRVVRGGTEAHHYAKHLGPAVHDKARLYMYFSCSNMVSGCPGVGMLRQPRDDPGVLQVLFKADCEHAADGPVHSQLRGANRDSLVADAGARSAAFLHVAAVAQRPDEEQLTNDVSKCGSTPQVVRQALYEARKLKHVHDKDVMVSVVLRQRAEEKVDLASTPDVDRSHRLWGGDTPLIVQQAGSNMLVLRMTDLQLQAYVHCRQQGSTGLFFDATEGMVSGSRHHCVHGSPLLPACCLLPLPLPACPSSLPAAPPPCLLPAAPYLLPCRLVPCLLPA